MEKKKNKTYESVVLGSFIQLELYIIYSYPQILQRGSQVSLFYFMDKHQWTPLL